MNKVYIVIRHTYDWESLPGDLLFLVGIFESYEDAKKVADLFEDDTCKIKEVVMNFVYPTEKWSESENKNTFYKNGIFLGGYHEG